MSAAWLTSWRAALRIARRETGRHRGRNALIVAMLALPVFGATAVDTVVASARLSTGETLTRKLGSADAWIQPYAAGGPIYQTPTVNPDLIDLAAQDAAAKAAAGAAPAFTQKAVPTPQQLETEIRAVLPNATLLLYQHSWNTEIHTADGYLFLESAQLDFRNKATAGLLDVRSGRLPAAPGELVLSTAAANQLGTRVGASVTVPGGSQALTVVGIVDRADSLDEATLYALPGTLPASQNDDYQWLVVNPGGVSWPQVEQLDTKGLLTVSRSVALRPPASSDVPYYVYQAQHPNQNGGPSSVSTAAADAAIVAVAVGLVLLEVVLLAGPAFAVSARRRQREYAVIGATGADRAHLRRIVLADGLVLGTIAGVVGAALGIGGAAAALPFLSHWTRTVPGAFQVQPLAVAGIAALALVLGLASALAPARKVSRQDIIASLTGRRLPTRAAWRLPVGGLVVTGIGLLAVLAGPSAGQNYTTTGPLILVLGVALTEVGCIMCTPMIVGALAGVGRVLPLGPRLALRDGARNRGRTTPAVAAMFAAVAGAVAAGTWFVSHDAQQRAGYSPQLLPNQVGISVADDKTAAALTGRLKGVLPVDSWFTTRAANEPGASADGRTTGAMVNPVWPASCSGSTTFAGTAVGAVVTASCGGGADPAAFTGAAIGGPDLLKDVTGISDPKAAAVLNAGGAVVFDPRLVHDGKATFSVVQLEAMSPGTTGGAAGALPLKHSTVDLPAVYVDVHGRPTPPYLLSTGAAAKLGVAGGRESLVLTLHRHITSVELQRANRVLAEDGLNAMLIVENGYQSKLGAANLITLAIAVLVAIGAAAIATGLSLADGQPDLETLAAVGGSPATRRLVAGSTALVVTGLGALIGVPVGFAIAEGMVRLRDLGVASSYAASLSNSSPMLSQPPPFVVPWLNIAVATVAVPVVTALGAALLTRSKLQVTRRIT